MKKKSPHDVVIDRRAQLKALASPVRVSLFEALLSQSPQSIKDLGSSLGVEHVGLYHHIKILVEAGLLVEAGVRGSGRDAQQTYKAAGTRLLSDVSSMSSRLRAEAVKVAQTHARFVLRRYTKSMTQGVGEFKGAARNTMMRHLSLELDATCLAEFNHDLDVFAQKWSQRRRARKGCKLSLMMLMGPG